MAGADLVLAIDQGTSSTKCVVMDPGGAVIASGSAPLGEHCPEPGWVEQDPAEIWRSVELAVAAVLGQIDPGRIACAGLSTQRESMMLWERETGRPLSPLLSWQDRRTSDIAASIGTDAVRRTVRRLSGLPLDPMFSALKARWLLDTYDPDRRRSEAGEIVLGTIDAFLLSRFGPEPITEIGNASRTQLLHTADAAWSPELAAIFGVPLAALPRIVSSTGPFPALSGLAGLDGVPITAVMGDSHAALFGHGVRRPGAVKATYGTGSSVMGLVGMAGERMDPGTCLTIGWQVADQPVAFAAEGNIRSSGATLRWMASVFGLEVEALVAEALASSSEGVHLVPAFNGLGAPHWDDRAQALISGFRLGTRRGALLRAGLESIPHQIADVVESVERTTGQPVTVLHADGGPSANDRLMQLQADLGDVTVRRSRVATLSAVGAAHLAALGAGRGDLADSQTPRSLADTFAPALGEDERLAERRAWRNAVARARHRPEGGAAAGDALQLAV